MTVRATLVAARPEARRIAEFLERDFGDEGVAVAFYESGDNWTVEAWFPDGTPDAVAAAVADHLGSDGFAAPLTAEAVSETDWVAESQKGLTPVATGRFIVYGSHSRRQVPAGRIGIRIDAGQAFGTGHHGTTAGCLETLDRLCRARRYHVPLDIGTGSGVLAIALARILKTTVLATDIDPVATRVARENAAHNHVAPRVRTRTAAGVGHAEIRRRAPFDLIVANILAEPLMRLAPEIVATLGAGGTLVLSGLLPAQRERVVAAYQRQGMRFARAAIRDGWAVLVFNKPPARRTQPGRTAHASRGRAGKRG